MKKFFDGYQVMFAVHTDKPHKHVHFLVGNCHIETGRAYRRSQKDLQTMCEFFGEQCMKRGLTNSVRKDYYNDDPDRDKETFAETQMKAKGCGCPVDTSAKQKHRPRRQPRLSKLGDKYTVKGINYELTKIWRGQKADRTEALTADTTKTADSVLHTGTDDKRSGAYPQGVRTITQGTKTGGSSNGISENAQAGNTAS